MVDFQYTHYEFDAADGNKRSIAYQKIAHSTDKPDVVWLCGLKSDMASTKVTVLSDWARQKGYGMLRFDYSGHGISSGNFEDGCIGDWLEDAVQIISHQITRPCILVGSSMGGWLSLLMAKMWAEKQTESLARICGLVMIAPAWDFTEDLMWARFSEEIKSELQDKGVYYQDTEYDDSPYAITYKLIEDGRKHLFKGSQIPFDGPVRILQGMQDPDVPWERAVTLVDMLSSSDVVLYLTKDGDHRLSRDQDIARLLAAVDEVGLAAQL